MKKMTRLRTERNVHEYTVDRIVRLVMGEHRLNYLVGWYMYTAAEYRQGLSENIVKHSIDGNQATLVYLYLPSVDKFDIHDEQVAKYVLT